MSDRERQAALGDVFRLLARDPKPPMKQLAARLYRDLDCDGYNCEADEALQALDLLRIDPTRHTGDVLGRTYGPVGPAVEPFPVGEMEGKEAERRGWRWARRHWWVSWGPKCVSKELGYRGCTRNSSRTVYLPSGGRRPVRRPLCDDHAEAYRKDHPEAVVVDESWMIEDFDPTTGQTLKEGGR